MKSDSWTKVGRRVVLKVKKPKTNKSKLAVMDSRIENAFRVLDSSCKVAFHVCKEAGITVEDEAGTIINMKEM